MPSSKHKTFRVGPLTPFKVDHYKDSLGLTIQADSSHPEHLEVVENAPPWFPHWWRIQQRQIEADKDLALNLKTHIGVMQGINASSQKLNIATERLSNARALTWRIVCAFY